MVSSPKKVYTTVPQFPFSQNTLTKSDVDSTVIAAKLEIVKHCSIAINIINIISILGLIDNHGQR